MTPHRTCFTGIALVTALLGPGAPAAAQDGGPGKAFEACMTRAGGVTVDMIECIGSETERQDARLNHAYQALRSTLGTARRQQLQEAQRAWITFRDRNCAFLFDPDGGSIARVAASDCVLRMTAERAGELERLMPERTP